MQRVVLGGTPYYVDSVNDLSHLGSRFFGVKHWILQDLAGQYWHYVGKRLAGNVRLSMVGRESTTLETGE